MAQRLSAQDHLFVLTGAGVSAESGLPTFRGVKRDLARATGSRMWRLQRRLPPIRRWCGSSIPSGESGTKPSSRIRPTLLWRNWSAACRSGSSCVRRMSIRCMSRRDRNASFTCMAGSCSRAVRERIASTAPFDDRNLYQSAEEIPKCRACGAPIRPHICWFGEVPFHMELILHQLEGATVLLTVGTSGVVEPAASFVRMARRNGAQTIYVGPEEPSNVAYFDEVLLGKAGQVLAGPGGRCNRSRKLTIAPTDSPPIPSTNR